LDSLKLNIQGFDSWNQNFTVSISNDNQTWIQIAEGNNITGIFSYPISNIVNSNAQYSWSTGANTSSIIVSPEQSTTYSVTIVQDGETCYSEVLVSVNNSITRDTVVAEILLGSTYTFNNQILGAEGIYTATFVNNAGCDSVVTLVLTYKATECSIEGNSEICLGESSILAYESSFPDTTVWGPNLLNGIFSGGTTTIIAYEAKNGSNLFSGTSLGTGCNQSWRPYGTLCDEGQSANSPLVSQKSNNSSGATWRNTAVNGYGVLIFDLQNVKSFNSLTAFQMFSDGKYTSLSLFD
jgi:hypothetical protein